MKTNRYITLLLMAVLFGSLRSFAQVSEVTMQQIQTLLKEKSSRTAVQQKIDSRLLQAIREGRGEAMAAGVNLLRADVDADAAGTLKVDISATVTPSLLSKITSLGGSIIYPSAQYHTVRAVINLKMVETIAAYPEVTFIQPAVKYMLVDVDATAAEKKAAFEKRAEKVKAQLKDYIARQILIGKATSQGDATHRAVDVRNTYGYLGQGIKIGVLSDSYNAKNGAAANITSGDLPGPGNPDGYTTPVTVLADYPSGSDEGRAMLQVIHDLAPAATLYFATADLGEASFADNIVALRNTYGCNIILDDVFYFDEPAFQDGIVAQAVNTVTAAGALYFSSAGNSGSLAKGTSGVFEGDFNDAGSPPFTGGTKSGTIHNFGTVASPVNGDIVTTAGIVYNLNWSDPYGASTNDYDLFLVSASGTVKSSSTNVQNGTQNPYEQASALSLSTGDRLVVFKTTGAAVRAFHLNTNRGELTIGTNGQTHGHASAAAAFCMAATPANKAFQAGAPVGPYPNPFVSTNKVEDFSSDGPRRKFLNPDGTPISGGVTFASNGGTLLAKPDLTAADGVSTTFSAFSGLNPFYGTSCAAPHAGAIAALLLSGNPSLTTTQVRNILTSTALDIESSGYDNVSGYGIIQAFQAAGQVSTPTCNAPTGLRVTNITATSATANWLPVTGANSYTLQYKVSTASSFTTITGIDTNYQTLTGLTPSTKYYFHVASVCSSNSSAYSALDSFTTSAPTACNSQYDGTTHNTFATAVAIPVNTDVNGTISSATDVDYYKFTITSTGTAKITLTTLPANYDLYIYTANQKQVAASKKTGTTSESIAGTISKAGVYYIKVVGVSGAFNANSCYTLNVTLGTATGNKEDQNSEDRIDNKLITSLDKGSFHVFPNPVSSLLTVNTSTVSSGAVLKVTDVFGKTILTQTISSSSSQLNVSKLAAGTYLVAVINKDGSIANKAKFVKE